MKTMLNLNTPFFEIGPKTYLYGEAALELAQAADSLCEKYSVDIIFTAQYTDIENIAKNTRFIKVFAQHMDCNEPGRGVGAVLPEAIKQAGAVGVLLNHAEKPLSLDVLAKTIVRAKLVGLATLVCAGSCEEAMMIAHLTPNIILAESPALIGKGIRTEQDMAEIQRINQSIHAINPTILVLHGAGISNEKDVYAIIQAGADATGSTSGIIKADDPILMLEKMIAAVNDAWQLRNQANGE
ncbi:triose-phosphate isomerase [Providencia vermicola]|uniref:triose-phosphate isomerase n=1 Tax=Providencia vermicola TaxID=333965 RepID=UPI001CED1C7C|nr:triose-phosphate isomerase [Providencia vermicola]